MEDNTSMIQPGLLLNVQECLDSYSLALFMKSWTDRSEYNSLSISIRHRLDSVSWPGKHCP